MKKNQWNDIMACVRLTKYGMNAKMSFGSMVLFTVIGIAFEFMNTLGMEAYRDRLLMDFGALFLYAAGMFPAQILMTLDLSGMVQASPHKKRIQTSAMSFVSLCGNLAALLIVVLIRGLSACIMPQRAELIWFTLPVVGLMGMGIAIMGALLYKFYIVSLIVISVVFGGVGSMMSISRSTELEAGQNVLGSMSVPVAIVLCAAMILLGNGIQYLLTRVLYKRPYSKGAFGSAVAKKYV